MTELEMYKKMYATVVGAADDAIQIVAGMLVGGECNREGVLKTGERLKKGIMDAEELYLDADVEEEP